MNFKEHQVYAIIAIVFLFLGALLHYVLITPTISDKVETAYELGRIDGKQEELELLIKNFHEADSVCIDSNRIMFYTFDYNE